ncbi:MAG: hypothetical protein A2505_00670 [Deltaproteobacteria bacterium RIFOXYD12_FULL_55_16]|nr:MAG: hypothetical protein A2505_00670 [Deltaproteobacteria bacterium RIFOXYD12_FULL_55_16]
MMKGCLRVVGFLLFAFLFPCHGQAQELRFAEILEQALVQSYDLKIGGLEVEIGEQRLAEARAMYLPTLSLSFTNEYLHDLSKGAAGTVSVGETIISGNESTYQHSVSLSAQYLLYDFGARPLKYQNSQRNVVLAQHAAAQRLIDLKIEVLSLYGAGLKLHKKIEIWSAMLGQRKEVYQFTQRLVAAGNKGKLEQGNAAIALAEALQNCESLRLEMAGVLEKLTYYTGKNYQMAQVRFSDFPEKTGTTVVAEVLNLPEIKAYDVAIEQKKAEYDIALRQWLPTLSLYSAYRMYGADPVSFSGSFENLEEKNATIGIVLNLNLFNGFADQAKAGRLQKELLKLQVEKAKKVAEDEQKVRTLAQLNILSEQGLEDWRAYRVALNEQGDMGERLAEQQILDRISRLQQKGAQLEKQLTLELAGVERCLSALQLQILAEGAS